MFVAGHTGDMRVTGAARWSAGDRNPLRGNALRRLAFLGHVGADRDQVSSCPDSSVYVVLATIERGHAADRHQGVIAQLDSLIELIRKTA